MRTLLLLLLLSAMWQCLAEIRVPLTRRTSLRTRVPPITSPSADIPATPWSVNLTNSQNVSDTQFQYTGVVTLGQPPQEFDLIFDTGSSVRVTQWLWVASQSCGECEATHYFNPQASSSYQSSGKSLHLYYGQGDCAGEVSADTVGLSSPPLVTASSQPFILVSSEEDFGESLDGILVASTQGLAFSKLSSGYDTFVDTLFASGAIDQKVFSVYLSTTEGQGDDKSNVIFGGSDVKAYFEPGYTNTVPVTDSGYWSVHMNYLTVAGVKVSLDASYAIIDTGTSLLAVYQSDFGPLIKALTAGLSQCGETQDGFIACECEDAKSLPTFTLTLGGFDFDVGPELYVETQQQGGTTYCFLLIQAVDLSVDGHDAWILGDVFIRGYYMVFDMENSEIGIAGGTATTHFPSHSGGSSGLRTWEVVVIVIGALVGVAAVGTGLWCVCRRGKRRGEYAPQERALMPQST